eukprot:TRINITY_DN25996_c0_g1_i1.p1 TRINITY_DN25996_c0_g1~~TRINITY_DN25996_c0_g1_i1.p1  ORF type:complete len:448 (+),score=69.17 TRINITY_DN25996_c0_g1_i1:76-1419(+)
MNIDRGAGDMGSYASESLCSEGKKLPPLYRGVTVLSVFCLHNAFNCWNFLNASQDNTAAMLLFQIDDAEIGLLPTVGLLSIFCTLPLAMVCKRRRTLLAVAGFMNLAAPFLRYAAALQLNYTLNILSFIATGFAFGVITVWPPILAACFFSPKRCALALALATLSNYVGGAASAIFLPMVAQGTAEGLKKVLFYQLFAAAGMSVLTTSWFWVPSFEVSVVRSMKEDVRVFQRPAVLIKIFGFGMMLGTSVALQSLTYPVLFAAGFRRASASAGNFTYEVSSAIIGVGLGSLVTERKKLKRILRYFSVGAFLSSVAWFVLIWLVQSRGDSFVMTAAMLIVETLQGAMVLGLLPFLIQEAVALAQPASENFTAGLVNLLSMVPAALVNQIGMMVSPVVAAAIVVATTALLPLCLLVAKAFPKQGSDGEHSRSFHAVGGSFLNPEAVVVN